MASAGKWSREPDLDDLQRQRRLGFGAAQHQDIGVVVLATGARAFEILDERGADAGKFVCGDRHANAAGANELASIRLAGRDALRHFARVIGIVHRLPVKGSMVVHVDTLRAQANNKKILELDAAVIATKRNHDSVILCRSLLSSQAVDKENRRTWRTRPRPCDLGK